MLDQTSKMSDWLYRTWQNLWAEAASPTAAPNHSSLDGPKTPSPTGSRPTVTDAPGLWPTSSDLDLHTSHIQNENDIDTMDQISMDLLLYIPPLLIILGLILNALVIAVLRSRHFRHSPSSLILALLAVLDILTLLLGLLPIWIGQVTKGQNEFQASRWGCRAHWYLTNTLRMFSMWTVALACLERAFAMKFPLKSQILFNRTRLTGALCIMVVLVISVNIHLWWSTDFTGGGLPVNRNLSLFCGIVGLIRDNYIWREVYFWYNFLALFALPSVVIASCAAAIVWKILHDSAPSSASNLSMKFKPIASTSAMVMCLAFVYLITTSPSDLLNMFLYYFGFRQSFHLAKLLVVCFDLWYHVSNVINFLLYCISGREFKHALSAVFCGENTKTCKLDTISEKV